MYLLWSGTLFSTSVITVVVAKLVILGISSLERVVLVAKLVISGILSSISLMLALYTSFNYITFHCIT